VSAASALFRAPEPLDAARHGALRITPLRDFSIAARMHAVFVAATEIPEAALAYPIVFVQPGDLDADGRPAVSPVALLGLVAGENLFVEGTRWKADYLPAFVRRFPFVSGSSGPMIDSAWSGLSPLEGEPLFDAQGRPTAVLDQALEFLGRFDAEARRTRGFCTRLVELDLLQPMQADATLPDGQRLTVEGFRVIDEERLRSLPDAVVLELHRSGMLMLAHLHRASLVRMRQLVEMKARRTTQRPHEESGANDGPTG
jgi:hypothetical protein